MLSGMEQRGLGRVGSAVGVVGLGAWQISGDWGGLSDEDGAAVLDTAVDAGVTFIDTADVYGDGRSERACGALLARRPGAGLFVATKMGRRVEQVPQNYTRANFLEWNDRSRDNLGVDTIDLVQLHTPPTEVFRDDRVFDALDEMVDMGRIRHYGVSVETCEQALLAIARPRVATVQIILNCLRLRPLEEVVPAARQAGVGIIARVPLASGLLSGKYDERTSFPPQDHRTYNRNGEAFDVGETFSGVPYEVGLAAVRELAGVVPPGMAMAQFALRWIVAQPGVSVVIPGARTPEQARANTASAELPGPTGEQLDAVAEIYDRLVAPHVHDRW
jgi:aryl-alcohol dehydrogenase-like predicted oxidoreductase